MVKEHQENKREIHNRQQNLSEKSAVSMNASVWFTAPSPRNLKPLQRKEMHVCCVLWRPWRALRAS